MFGLIKAKIWFYRQTIDFRKQINGLALLLAGEIGLNPGSGEVFIFRSKRVDKLKILYWDCNGFWLIYRKLEQSRFKFPHKDEAMLEVTNEQLQWLLSGLNIEKIKINPPLKPTVFH